MSLVNIKQLRNLPTASQGALILYNGTSNVWSNTDNSAVLVPVGTTAERPVSPVNGFIRYNTTLNSFEFYENGNWRTLDKITLSSLGISGQSLFEYVSGNSEITFKTIEGNGIINIYSSSGTIYVSANALKSISVSSLGLGTQLYSTVSAGKEIHLRTLEAGGIIEISAKSTGEIVVSAKTAIRRIVNQSAHGFAHGDVIYLDDDDGIWKLALSTSADTLGVALVNYIDTNNFEAIFAGEIFGLSGLIPGNYYFTSSVSAGKLQITEPSSFSNPIIYSVDTSIAMVLPYRPSETTENFVLSISGLGAGISVLRNVEGGSQIVYKTLVDSPTIKISASPTSIEFNVDPSKLSLTERIYFRSGDFDNPNNSDWYVPTSAPAITDSLNNSLTVRSFDDLSPYKGVGGIVRVPNSSYSTFQLGFVLRSPIAPVTTQTVVFGFGFKKIPNNSPISTWIVSSLPSFPITTNTNYQYFTSPLYNITDFGLTHNQVIQFEIWREVDNVLDTLSNEVYLLEFYIEFGV